MKNIIVLLLLLATSVTIAQTSYSSHRVQKGETVYNIAKQHQITEQDIYQLNPEAKNSLKVGSILIIPKSLASSSGADQDKITFKKHKVKRKETIFGIATRYGTTVDEIKKYNKHLYAQELKKGEKIKIPIKRVKIITPPNTSVAQEVSIENPSGKHKVKPQETKYSIAKKYNISIEALEALNPSIYGTNVLPLGMLLTIPNTDTNATSNSDTNYRYYTVKPKEGFYRLKVLFNLSEEDIIALNPHAKDGLKEGMVLKIPNEKSIPETIETTTIPVSKINLEQHLKYLSPKNVVVFLPFGLDKMKNDSIQTHRDILLDNKTTRIAVDFYTGLIIASEFAKKQGISINLHVFDFLDTQMGVNELFRKNNINQVDVVIGPLRQALVEEVAATLKNKNIPVLSPLSNKKGKMYPNFIQSIPQQEVQEKRMIDYLVANHQGKNLILISDKTSLAKKQKLQARFQNLKLVNSQGRNFLRATDISSLLSNTQENWVLLESTNATFVSSAVGILNSLNTSKKLRLFTLDKNDAFDFREVSNLHLAKLQFTFPSWNKFYDINQNIAFVTAYKEKYDTPPSRYATRGFDITYDALLRLAYAESIFEANDALEGETTYVENKFKYQKTPSGGYENKAVYILKYDQDLNLQEVE